MLNIKAYNEQIPVNSVRAIEVIVSVDLSQFLLYLLLIKHLLRIRRTTTLIASQRLVEV